jgi:hypothetical protein
MDRRQLTSGICWFGATCLAFVAFGLALVSIEVRSGEPWSAGSLTLVVLAAFALFVMAVLMTIGFRLDRPPVPAEERLGANTNHSAAATIRPRTGE